MLGFFYFVLNSPTLTCDVTCSVTLLGQTKYEEAISDEHILVNDVLSVDVIIKLLFTVIYVVDDGMTLIIIRCLNKV